MGKKNDLTGRRFGILKALKFSHRDKHGHALYLFECDCGNQKVIRGKAVSMFLTKSCGCLAKPKNIIGNKYGRWTVISFSHRNKKKKPYFLCQCNCGIVRAVLRASLIDGKSNSCGCLSADLVSQRRKRDITGLKSGKLTAIECTKQKTKDGHFIWLCSCDCGRNALIAINSLTTGNTKSCGNCGFFANSMPVSSQQIAISEMLNGKLNYSVNNLFVDVALPGQKIAIEYDSWYWHGGKIEQDRDRCIKILNDGWKLLSVKSNMMIPDKENILHKIFLLCPDAPYQELILDDWGKSDYRTQKG